MGMIDKEKIIKGLEGMIDYFFDIFRNDTDSYKCAKAQEYSDCAIDAIALLKEQEEKTGHWIYLQDCANEGVYCSECHTKMFDHYPMKKKLSQFCAHCGAKMDEDVEGL